jgi:hypothetical protein
MLCELHTVTVETAAHEIHFVLMLLHVQFSNLSLINIIMINFVYSLLFQQKVKSVFY